MQPVIVEALVDGAWKAITQHVFDREAPSPAITETRGRPSEIGQTPPARCTLQLNNKDGRYSPRNPLSPLYGKIGRNTQLRLALGTLNHAAAVNVDLIDKTDQVAPSVNSPSNQARLFCAWAAPLPAGTYTYPGSMTGVTTITDAKSSMGQATEALTATGPTGTRTATLSTAEDYLAASVVLTGPSLTIQETETDTDGIMATDAGTQAGWWVLLFTYWAWDNEDDQIPHFPVSDEGGWLLVADTGTVNAADADAAYFRMKAWLKQVKTPGVHNIRIEGPTTSLSVMRVISGVTAWSPRFIGEVPAWPTYWDDSGVNVWVPIEAAGILRHLGQGKALRSALTRRVPTRTPSRGQFAAGQGVVAYWPMEDLGGTRMASGLSGGVSMVKNAQVELAVQDGPPGSLALPNWKQNGSAFGKVPSIVKYGSNPTITKALGPPWRVDWVFFMGTAPASGGREMISIFTSSDNAYRWTMNCSLTGLSIDLEDDTGTSVHSNPFGSIPSDFYGNWMACDIEVRQSGSNVAYVARIRRMDGTVVASWAATVSGTRLAGRPASVGLVITSADERSLGHVTVSADSATSPVDPFGDAHHGYTGETASDRFERLCDEENLQCMVVGDAQSLAAGQPPRTQPMGPQSPVTVLELLAECADADGGILYEPREFLGVALRTRRSLYNQAALLPLDYNAQIMGRSAPVPVDDDQATRNDITVMRKGGSSYRATRETGPLSTLPPPDGVGVYDDQVTINIDDDNDLPNQGTWRLHLGTVDEPRYPLIDLNLISYDPAVGLALAAGALDVGDRATIDNLPDWLPPDQASLMAQGFVETLDTFGRSIKVNTSPEKPWQVAVWGNEPSMSFPGGAGDYVHTPDTGVLDITGDIDIRARVKLADWTPAINNWIFSKIPSTGSQRSYGLFIDTTGAIGLQFSADGSTPLSRLSTVATGFVDGTAHWVRAVLDVDNGAAGHDAKFYTSPDGVVWTQLGATVTTGGTTSIFSSSSDLEIGARNQGGNGQLTGSFYQGEVRNGIDGSIVTRPIVGPTGIEDPVAGLPYSLHGAVSLVAAGGDRWDSTHSQLNSSFAAGTATTMSVAVTDGPLWTTVGGQFPFEIECGGARLKVTGISGASSPQTFTVQQAPLNGVVKTIPAGTPVRLWKTPIWAL